LPEPSQADTTVLRLVFAFIIFVVGMAAGTIQIVVVSRRPNGAFYPVVTMVATVVVAYLFMAELPRPRTKAGKVLRHPLTAAIGGAIAVWALGKLH
jgi:multisubunit Na+/H+ antiporter MnhB subunit